MAVAISPPLHVSLNTARSSIESSILTIGRTLAKGARQFLPALFIPPLTAQVAHLGDE